jgi:hypothetical protein
MSEIKALDNLCKLASDFRSDVYKRDEADFVLEIADEIEREINERYIPKPDVPTNQKTELTGINDIHEAARNLLGCASFAVETNRPITIDDFHDALGALVTIADMYYFKLPLDADNEPIRMGDEIECRANGYEGTFTVFAIGDETIIGNHEIEWIRNNPSKWFHVASYCRHVKHRTLEDVLLEFGNKVKRDCYSIDIEKYADEIRELMGGDA